MAKIQKISDLKANPNNPRKASEERVELLRHTISEFGDISGIVYNRKTDRLVGGHKRGEALPPDAKIKIIRQYEPATKTGTVAVGYVLHRGERFSFRAVDWSESKEKAANLAANKGAGEWDEKLLSQMLRELDEEGFDLDLTLFQEDELSSLLVPTTEPNFEEGSEADQSSLDKKKAVCPACGESFTVAGRL